MLDNYVPKVRLYRGNSATVRLAIDNVSTGNLIQRSEIVRMSAKLARMHPDPKVVANWNVNIEDAITDGPVFHAQDAGWPYTEAGYNFIWTLGRGYLDTAPAKYKLFFEVAQPGLVLSTHECEIEVLET